MGCDIHLYVEVRQADGGVWKTADAWRTEEWDPNDIYVPYDQQYYSGRNYNLFAILANVRNGDGFGVDRGDPFNPISEPRGIPEDSCPQIKYIVERWNGDGHSSSYFTLQELLDYDWTQKNKCRGCVGAMEFLRWIRWSRDHGYGPSSYCGGVGGAGVQHISPVEMENRIKALEFNEQAIADKLGHHYCLAEWEEFYYQSASDFWSSVIPRLLRLAVGRTYSDVRIVFFFDN